MSHSWAGARVRVRVATQHRGCAAEEEEKMAQRGWKFEWVRILLVLLFVVCAFVPARAAWAKGPPPDDDVAAIEELLNGVLAAFLDADADALDALTSDPFTWVGSDGVPMDRDGWLEAAAASAFEEMELSNYTMEMLAENIVLVTANLDGAGGEGAEAFAIFETETIIAQENDDGWQVAYVHGTDRRAETEAYWAAVMREAMWASLPTLTIDVAADGIDVPEEVMAGPTLVELTNSAGTTNEDGSPILADTGWLVEDATLDDLLPLLADANENPGPALELVKLYGTQIVPGGRMVWDLQPGAHVAVTTGGEPLLAEFTVTEAEEGTAEVQADVQVQLVDFSFVLPDTVAAGPHLWEISNAGTQWHEMIILQMQEGMTVEDLLGIFAGGPQGGEEEGAPLEEDTDADATEAMTDTAEAGGDAGTEGDAAGPPEGEMPFDMLYGYVAISEGNRAWVEVDLPPGEYTVICFLPDLMGDMSPHATHGMVRTLVVE